MRVGINSSPPSGRRRPAVVPVLAGVIVLAGYGASLAVNLPGHFGPDALWQLEQGRSGVFNDWHPPVMAWLLGLADRVSPGAPLFVVVNSALFFGGLLAFAALEPRPRPICLPVLAILAASPLALVYQGDVLKDVLFANAAMSGFAALAWAGKVWDRPAWRWSLLLLALALFSLAALARQNGLVVPLCGAAALSAIVWTRGRPTGWTPSLIARGLAHGVLAMALVMVVAGLATQALDAHGDGKPENSNQLKRLQIYDLAGATRLDPAVSLAILRKRRPDLERFVRDQAAPIYRAASSDNIAELPAGETMMAPAGDVAGKQWAALITGRPLLYLRARTDVFLATLLTPSSAGCPLILVGVDGGDPALLRHLRLRARYDGKDEWDDDYASSFIGTPVFSHLFYLAVVVALTALALRQWLRGDRRPGPTVALAMGAAALLFTASFFVVSGSCDYRYLYFLDVAAMAALVRQAAARRLPSA